MPLEAPVRAGHVEGLASGTVDVQRASVSARRLGVELVEVRGARGGGLRGVVHRARVGSRARAAVENLVGPAEGAEEVLLAHRAGGVLLRLGPRLGVEGVVADERATRSLVERLRGGSVDRAHRGRRRPPHDADTLASGTRTHETRRSRRERGNEPARGETEGKKRAAGSTARRRCGGGRSATSASRARRRFRRIRCAATCIARVTTPTSTCTGRYPILARSSAVRSPTRYQPRPSRTARGASALSRSGLSASTAAASSSAKGCPCGASARTPPPPSPPSPRRRRRPRNRPPPPSRRARRTRSAPRLSVSIADRPARPDRAF